MFSCHSLNSPTLSFPLPPPVPSPLRVHKSALHVCLCVFAKIQGSSPTPTFISPHSVINSCWYCLQNAPQAWAISLFLRCSSSNQDVITSGLDPDVAFQLITLFSFLPPTSNLASVTTTAIFKKHQSSFSPNIPKLLTDFRIKFQVWPWSTRPVLGKPLFFYLTPLYPWDIPLSSLLYSNPLAFSAPFKYATASCLPRIFFLQAILPSLRLCLKNLSQSF